MSGPPSPICPVEAFTEEEVEGFLVHRLPAAEAWIAFDLDEETLRPYFSLDRVRDGAFALAGRLYGITFVRRTDLPVYHPEVSTFEVY
jgi:hypothetical protein